MDVFKKRNKVTKEEKEKAATKAGSWLRKLEKLEGRAYGEAWNKMVVEAVAQEVDDLSAYSGARRSRFRDDPGQHSEMKPVTIPG